MRKKPKILLTPLLFLLLVLLFGFIIYQRQMISNLRKRVPITNPPFLTEDVSEIEDVSEKIESLKRSLKRTERESQGYKCNFLEIDDKTTILNSDSTYDSVGMEDKEIEEMPQEIKNILINELIEGYKWENQCERSGKLSEIDFEFNNDAVDLNDDGEKEYIIMPWKICGGMSRGASGNGEILVWGKINGKWKQIGNLDGNAYFITDEKTDNYHNILTHWHSSAGRGTETLYKWSKPDFLENFRYEPIFTKWYQH